MRNIELKARVRNLRAVEAIARDLDSVALAARMRQVDTYYDVPDGRLKLREIFGSEERWEVIFYRRLDQRGPKRSDYEVAPVGDPARLKRVFDAAFGVRCVVRKERTVYLLGNTRIHLDSVAGLGEFLEFEVVMSGGEPDADGEERVRQLMAVFGISPHDLVESSYVDMISAGP